MAVSAGIFQGSFRVYYLGVKAAAQYAGCFFLCYFWPLFLQAALMPPVTPQGEALAALVVAPLGFLILGGIGGWRLGGIHVLLLALAGAAAWLAWPAGRDLEPEAVLAQWLPALVAAYAVGMGFGWRRQLQRYGAVD